MLESTGVALNTSETTKKLFDANSEFKIKILSGRVKTCSVSYPTDAQWCERARRNKEVRKNLGRKKSVPITVPREKQDAELFNLIRRDSGESFTDAEASSVIINLDDVSVEDIKREADIFIVKLKVMRYTTTHHLRIPLKEQALRHSRMSVYRQDEGRLRTLKMLLEPSGELYDELVISSSGYAEGSNIPINHKFAVVYEVLNEAENALADEDEDGDLEDMDPEG